MVAMRTRTPGPQVGLYRAYRNLKWWSSEELEPRMPKIVNEARHQSAICCMGVSEWLYEMVAARNVPVQNGAVTKWLLYEMVAGRNVGCMK